MADEMEVEGAAAEGQQNGQPELDPEQKVINDICCNYDLLERAVVQFDARFILRALRSISIYRGEHFTAEVLGRVVALTFPADHPSMKRYFDVLGLDGATVSRAMQEADKKLRSAVTVFGDKLPPGKLVLPEVEVYLGVLIQVFLYDDQDYEAGADFSTWLVDKIRELNRRTLDTLGARAYFYLHLFYENLTPHPPSPQSPVISIRGKLLAALRSAVLRKDEETQAAAIVLLLRNYISTADIVQADALIAQTDFPAAATNNQVARYLYYLGRIRAVQLQYTEAHEHLQAATRKAPSTAKAGGFYQSSMKFLVVVELLMGDIPERSIFSQPRLERALEPYFRLVKAVRTGEMQGFLKIVEQNATTFQKDSTYTLILRLRQNVIRTGIRRLSLSYSRISLRDICIRLGLESEESAEYIVAKAIRDGVIEATIDHEKGYMQTKQAGDIYATREPAEAFHERILACLAIHNECVKAMRYPMNQHRLELKNAQEARERERELAKEIQEGDVDDEGDFEGL